MHSFQPRKKPIQGRSKATVEAILEGTIRVLLDEGFETLTTTRVAEVAGVGVGTLYQYFPAKESLLFALLEREMTTLEAELLGALVATVNQSLEARVTATIDALVRHKKAHAELGVVLQAHMPRFNGIRVVRATVRRIVSAFAVMIRPSLPASMDDAEVQLRRDDGRDGGPGGDRRCARPLRRDPPASGVSGSARTPRPRLSPRVGREAFARRRAMARTGSP